MNEKTSLVERRVDTKLVIMSAWIAVMCLYIYCDIYSLYRPGQIDSMMKGKIGFLEISQVSLFWVGVLMAIPSLMIFITPLANAGVCRIINLVISSLYVLVNIGNLAGEIWAYYYLFGLLELGLVIAIFIMALRWPRQSS